MNTFAEPLEKIFRMNKREGQVASVSMSIGKLTVYLREILLLRITQKAAVQFE